MVERNTIKCIVIFKFVTFFQGYATSMEKSSASTNYYSRGDYIPGFKLNGMDVVAVREAVKFAREYASSKSTPIVMELLTYRYLIA